MNFGIIGGDTRYEYLAELLGGKCRTAGLSERSRAECDNTLGNVLTFSNVIILPIPLTRDTSVQIAPHFPPKVWIDELLPSLQDKTVFAGAVSKEIAEEYPFIIDYSTERFAYKNAVLTVEGLLAEMIALSVRSICNSRILIIGFGRIGSIAAKYLNDMRADICIAARNPAALEKAAAFGFEQMNISNISLSGFDYVINTAPTLVIDSRVLSGADQNTMIFDLASKPGGTDFAAAEQMGISAHHLLALPSRHSPKTAAQYIYDEIMSILENER